MYFIGTILFFFFFNDTATTEIYTLSLHDALPISAWFSERSLAKCPYCGSANHGGMLRESTFCRDRKSTRLNSSHLVISYAVFCLKKKKKDTKQRIADKKKKRRAHER